MAVLLQSAAYTRKFLMVLSSDHITGATGLSPVVSLSKATATSFTTATGAVVEVSGGWYQIPLATTDTGTLGELAFHATTTATTADPTDWVDQVAVLPVNVLQWNSTTVSSPATAGIPDVNVKNINNVAAATPGAAGGVFIAGTNAPVTITGSGDALTITSTGGNGTGLNVSGNGTGSGIKGTGGSTGVGIAGVGGATSGTGIKGLAQAGVSIGIEAQGSSSAAGFQAKGGTTGPGAALVGGATSGNGLNVTTTAGDGLSILPTAGSGIVATGNGTSKHGIVATGGTAGTSDGFKAAAGTGGVDIRGNITGNLTGTTSDFTTALTESYAADGAAPTPAQALFAIQQFQQEKVFTATQMFVKKLDGTTTAMTLQVDNAATPTTITRTL